jgi:putative colanic acid biosynthesis glycosyltransferase
MNKGIDLSKGEWLYFLGSDDEIYELNTLEKVFKDLFNSAKLIVGNIEYRSKNKTPSLNGGGRTIKKPSWSYCLWLKNSIHHQAIFYRREFFSTFRYSTKYKILSDYELNIILFKEKTKCYVIEEIIALCGTDGISKNYNWSLYKEEIEIKTKLSAIILKPFIFLISFFKYLLKKVL